MAPPSKSSFDALFQGPFEPLTQRGWLAVALIALASLGIGTLVVAADNRGTIGVGLLVLAAAGLILVYLVLYREIFFWVVRSLRRSNLGNTARMTVIVLTLLALPIVTLGLVVFAAA